MNQIAGPYSARESLLRGFDEMVLEREREAQNRRG